MDINEFSNLSPNERRQLLLKSLRAIESSVGSFASELKIVNFAASIEQSNDHLSDFTNRIESLLGPGILGSLEESGFVFKLSGDGAVIVSSSVDGHQVSVVDSLIDLKCSRPDVFKTILDELINENSAYQLLSNMYL